MRISQSNRKNGASRKTIKTASGSFELETPCERNGSFEPQTVKKHQPQLTDKMEHIIISLFALGNSYQSIHEYLVEMYRIEV